ncbi:MAG TPA: substrate-binding domain-containing protein [Usitatibacter sp.]|jgi:ABC-type molybdate transport system substrate-binding protein|nr:substrate-binding domain-containing protein [Usitatibacter sp.]
MIRAAFFALLVLVSTVAAQAAEVTVVAPAAARAAMTAVIPSFERQSGQKIVMDYQDGDELLAHAMKDERVDAVIAPVAPMGELARAYRILPDTRRTLGRTAPAPDAPQGAVLAFAALKGADHEDAARALSAYLTLPETMAVLRRNGLAAP